MNITLSADDNLIKRARQYAGEHGTSLNQLVRDYLERLVGDLTVDEASEEFAMIATTSSGNSRGSGGWSREEIYRERIDGIVRGR